MKTIRHIVALSIALLLLIVTGCLELAGQRITLRHDAAKDELHILIQYDGVHDSGKNEHGNGEEQVASAVANGEILLMDWPFHIKPKELKAIAAQQDAETPKAARDFLNLVGDSMSVKTIGYHRDAEDRIGGTQLVTIKNAKAFLKGANATISAMFMQNAGDGPEEIPRTWQLMLAAAGKDHQWLSLEGNALKWTMPIHSREWAGVKAKWLLEVARNAINADRLDEDQAKNELAEVARAVLALTGQSVSFSDADGMLVVRLGDVHSTFTARLDTGKVYKPNLEKAVEKAGGRNMDEVMAKLMVGDVAEKDEPLVAEVLKWGPPEEKVRGLIKAIKANDAKLAAKAIKKLESFAEDWNEKEVLPRAPQPDADTETYAQAWKDWQLQMQRFPLPGEKE